MNSAHNNIEIERKFLVDAEKWQQADKPGGVLYRQGYLMSENNCTIRVRVAGEKAFMTIKGASSGISRAEYEYEIPVADATEMLDNLVASEISKTRYAINFENKLWEVDVFLGDNAGLIVAEIELQSENEAFTKPTWITEEVSGDLRYYNSKLSVDPYKNWK
ncbi:MAG TPA: CYTH domain-containing protein [Mucilaginibacter sp.]